MASRGKCCSLEASAGDLRSGLFWRAILGEFVGTLFLVLIGCGSCASWHKDVEGGSSNWEHRDAPGVLQIALCFGLAVATMAWCLCEVSGSNMNPAVTIALVATRKLSIVKGVFYVVAQCAGAAAGAGILKGLTPEKVQDTLGATSVDDSMTLLQGFGVELLITFVLVLTVFAACDTNRNDLKGTSGPLAVGLSVTLCHLFAIKYTGASMNSARSFGPALIQNNWTHHWVYWTGPILGGLIAGFLYESVFAANASVAKAKDYLLSTEVDPNQKKRKDDEIAVEMR